MTNSISGIKRFGGILLAWLILFPLLCGAAAGASSAGSGDELPALTETVRSDIRLVRQYAAQLLAENLKPDYTLGGFSWDTEKRPAGWLYYNGFMLDALLCLNVEGSRGMAEAFFRDHILPDGSIPAYRDGALDSAEPMRPLVWHLMDDPAPDPRWLNAIRWVYARLEGQRVYPACGNNFLHLQDEKGAPAANFRRYPIILDGLYMTQPFLAKCASLIRAGVLQLTDRKGRPVTAEALEERIIGRYAWIQSYMYDRGARLYQHGWDVQSSAGNGRYWGRGIGWLAMSMADVIGLLPDGPGKTRLQGILIQLLDGMLPYQDEASGMWYNVVNRGSDLPGNLTETSVTCMMAYALVKVWNDGYAPGNHYLLQGLRAFHGVVETKMSVRDGRIHVHDTYLKSGAGDSDEYYCKEGYTTDEAKGTAALLMAAAVIEEALSVDTGE